MTTTAQMFSRAFGSDIAPRSAPTPFDRLPPHSMDAEMCVLGSLALCGADSDLTASILRHIDRADFYLVDHQIIFEAIADLHRGRKPVDAVILRAELDKRQLLEEIGGTAYMAELLGCVPSAAHGVHYAKIVREKALLRQVIDESNKCLQDAYSPHKDAMEVVARARARFTGLAAGGISSPIRSIGAAAADFVESRMNQTGGGVSIDTGLPPLDRSFRGLLTLGGYTLLAARPSMGKSSLLRHVLLTLAQGGHHCGLISVEESEDKIAGNAISNITLIENAQVAKGPWSRALLAQMSDAAASLSGVPLYVCDQATSLRNIVGTAEAMARDFACRIIAVDHLHLVSAPPMENRTQQLTHISAELKNLWKGLSVAGFVAAQLSRPGKDRRVTPPHLSDLRECGALEEHADVVLMLHREDYYHRGEDGYAPDNICEVLIRKNRNGPVGEADLIADLEHQRFLDPEDNKPLPVGI